ncbi:MAG: acyl-CoA/acyl-ACP dehydrogenase [Deltaproteobacteria bacterium]|nr:acyl-CoA/acyl-ACP dehydrogenase [Deltaproteobacteria bacterium]
MSVNLALQLNQNIKALLDRSLKHLANQCEKDGRVSVSKLDEHQVVLYDLSYIVSELNASSESFAALNERAKGDSSLEEKLSLFFWGQMFQNARAFFQNHQNPLALSDADLAFFSEQESTALLQQTQSPDFYNTAAEQICSDRKAGAHYWLSDDHNMFRETFKKFAEDKVKPLAESVHRKDLLIPEEIIKELGEMGCFGLSLPQKYGGFQDDAKSDNTGMIVVTEELSRGSLGIAGSLITRPEILGKAILKGGTEEQKQTWLPKMATGERMVAVAVTEPDYGSDVAGMKVAATKTDGGWLINGCKTWCTFAGYADTLLVLARTNPDMSLNHKGLSILIAEKPRFDGHEFEHTQESGGKISGRAIGTIGYRGMHSYEVFFDNYFVPDANVVGGEEGLGKGFYLQMEGFAGGRLQTAGRALGVMQAALEEAVNYANDRKVFGKPIADYQLTKFKIAKMAALIHVIRQFTYACARLMDDHKGGLEASMVKIYASRMAEWVSREAMQIHGGMGYAEEFPVSRLFVDARVFSIFEGAEETLILRVVARQLLEEALKGS